MTSFEKLDNYPPITAGGPGSFASFTILNRLPAILDDLIDQYREQPSSKLALQKLRTSLLKGKIGLLPKTGIDLEEWKVYLNPFIGKSWREVPFYFAEAYFYRMILDCVSYFENAQDPFFEQKAEDIRKNRDLMSDHLAAMDQQANGTEMLLDLLQLSLWGNKADLSQLHIERSSHSSDFTLRDDSSQIFDYLSRSLSRIDIVLDNSGLELFTDLLLANYLVKLSAAKKVVLHAKAFPTFVSDTTLKDIEYLLGYLEDGQNTLTKKFADSTRGLILNGSIVPESHTFWNAPLHFYEMSEDLHNELGKSDLLVFKGDANYRRIFGDRDIPYHLPPDHFADYLPSPALAIRVLKSEIMLGLPEEKVRELNSTDPDWLVSGQYGIIDFVHKCRHAG
jgi:hypothetical protein